MTGIEAFFDPATSTASFLISDPEAREEPAPAGAATVRADRTGGHKVAFTPDAVIGDEELWCHCASSFVPSIGQ